MQGRTLAVTRKSDFAFVFPGDRKGRPYGFYLYVYLYFLHHDNRAVVSYRQFKAGIFAENGLHSVEIFAYGAFG